jgi:RNA polymerase sigma factor (sigma-70 family)
VTLAHLRRNTYGAGLVRPEEDSEVFCDPTTPAELASRNERVALVHAVLDEMTELSREAFWLYEVEERPGSEVAARLGVSENTVRMRVRTARRTLRPVVSRFRELA